MRIFTLATIFITSCTAPNISDNRVMSDGKSNGTVATSSNANPATGETPAKPAGDPNPALANFLPVAYTDDLDPAMDQLCTAACHTGAPAPGPPILDTPEGLKAALGPATNAVTSGSMPPNQADLNAADKKILAQLGVSLKNWSKNEAYATTLSDFKISYSPAVSALNTALCLSCHSGAQPSGGLRLETQEQWKTAMPQILRAVSSGKMPPRIDEVQGPRLVKFLTSWQDQGFP